MLAALREGKDPVKALKGFGRQGTSDMMVRQHTTQLEQTAAHRKGSFDATGGGGVGALDIPGLALAEEEQESNPDKPPPPSDKKSRKAEKKKRKKEQQAEDDELDLICKVGKKKTSSISFAR